MAAWLASCADPDAEELSDATVRDTATMDTLAPVEVPAVDTPSDSAPPGPRDLGPCGADGACANDARCVLGRCVAWPRGAFDEACLRRVVPGPLRPALQCAWEAPPAGDPRPMERAVLHTPLVGDLGLRADPDAPPRPVVVFISDSGYREGPPRTCSASGSLRVIDGATCRELAAVTAMEDRLNSSVTPALGDLDGDGRVEVVAAHAEGGVVAFRWDPGMSRLVRAWRSRTATGATDLHGSTQCQWGGVTLADLDDDGRSEVLLDGAVWNADGVRVGALPGWTGFPHGVPAPVADVDNDGVPEIVGAEGTWQWSAATRAFVRESYFTGAGSQGFTALADLGEFPGMPGDGPNRPEVVVAGTGSIIVQTIAGAELFRFMAPSGVGGPPTVADFDGDGRPELGVAFAGHYVVYDVDRRMTLWVQPSQDRSSARTGSSVFDFNSDGRAEVVYGDECYVRIYDGRSGEVLFSQARFSSTWEENPIVADVDGDNSAEIVMPMSGPCVPAYCPEWDPIFRGLRCDVDGDCPGGPCRDGLCRCTMDAECGATYSCTAPLAGTPGAGQVCRARHRDCQPGLRIYRDARDRWAPSRPLWNQHAYQVTNVLDDGRIPRSSTARANWRTPGLNNFRQNVQGSLRDAPGADLTVGRLSAVCEGPSTRMRAEACNRGRAPLDANITVIFRHGSGRELCRLRTREPIRPGVCTPVECVAPVPAEGRFEAVVDPDDSLGECTENNNLASGLADCIG